MLLLSKFSDFIFENILHRIGPGTFRLILATAVLISHIGPLRIGKTAVMLFFMLSGYWITQVYCEKYSKYRDSYKIFIVSRFLRIYPLYIVCVLIGIVFLAVANDYDKYSFMLGINPTSIRNIILLSHSSIDQAIIGVAWSLDIELQFYLVLPLLIFLLAHMKTWQTLILTVLLLVYSMIAIKIGWKAAFFPNVINYLGVFLLGVLIYKFDYRPSRMMVLLSCACFIGLFLLFAAIPDTRTFVIGESTLLTRFPERDVFAVFASILLAPYVAYNVRQPTDSIDRSFGDMSYPLYLIHLPVSTLLHSTIRNETITEKIYVKTATIFISFILTYILFKYIDKPLNRRRASLVNTMFSKTSKA